MYILPYPSIIPPPLGNLVCPFWGNLNDADEIESQQQEGYGFNATFITNAVSNYTFDEEVVTCVDDDINWTGQEYGFRTSLENDTIYGYVQDGTKMANGYTYFYSVPLMHNDNKKHYFKVLESSSGGANTFYYYIDGVLKGTIVHSSPANYSQQSYYIIMTTHRWDNGWNSNNSSLSVSNLTVFEP